MRAPSGLTFRIVVLALVAGVLSAAIATSPMPGRSPYVSAISDLVAASANAAPTSCGNTGCNRYGHCSKVRGYNCVYSAGECSQTAC
jgi:hypothetical protein